MRYVVAVVILAVAVLLLFGAYSCNPENEPPVSTPPNPIPEITEPTYVPPIEQPEETTTVNPPLPDSGGLFG